MKVKKLKLLMIHDWGSFPSETLISIGHTQKETVKWCKLKKNGVSKGFANWIELEPSVKNAFEGTAQGTFVYGTNDHPNDKLGYSILIIPRHEDEWRSWEVLMHELHHAVHWVTKKHSIYDEAEAQAYTFDQSFRTIRRKLQKLD